MQFIIAEEMAEMSRKWREAQADSRVRKEEAQRLSNSLEQDRAYGRDTQGVVFRLWSDGQNPGSFESNHGCWDHFRKIG